MDIHSDVPEGLSIEKIMDYLVKQGLVTVRLQGGFKTHYSLTKEGEQLIEDWDLIDSPEYQKFLDESEAYLETLT